MIQEDGPGSGQTGPPCFGMPWTDPLFSPRRLRRPSPRRMCYGTVSGARCS